MLRYRLLTLMIVLAVAPAAMGLLGAGVIADRLRPSEVGPILFALYLASAGVFELLRWKASNS
jgi:hypothetical protein